MKRSTKRILTTHVGSLVRSPELKALAKSGNDGKDAPDVVRRATAEVVRKQAAIGLDIISDGEFGKSSWSAYVLSRITGFEIRPDRLRPVEWLGRDLQRFGDVIGREMPSALTGRPTEACVGAIEYRDHTPVRRTIANFQNALKGALKDGGVEEAFLTAVAPASTAYDGVNEFYPSDKDYIFALAEALRQEYLEIHNAGLLLQVDDAVLANMYDHLVQQSPERYREWAQLRVDALNHALRGIPEDRIRYHFCWGSWHGPHAYDLELKHLVDILLSVKAQAYLIEGANARHEHEYAVWETAKLPAGKILIPGVITHSTDVVEHPELVCQRILRFTKLLGQENVIAGADCGFGGRTHPQIAWAKLRSLVDGAKLASASTSH